MYEQADALLSKATFPESDVSNNQHARYLYYSGRVRAVQLNYTESYRLLLAAQRKAPQQVRVPNPFLLLPNPQQRARGFRIAVLKLATVVQLLMGDIPDKSSLASPDTAVAVSAYAPNLTAFVLLRLGPLIWCRYKDLASAVRSGELETFQRVGQKASLAQRCAYRHQVATVACRRMPTRS
jgi:hypothetical protein